MSSFIAVFIVVSAMPISIVGDIRERTQGREEGGRLRERDRGVDSLRGVAEAIDPDRKSRILTARGTKQAWRKMGLR